MSSTGPTGPIGEVYTEQKGVVVRDFERDVSDKLATIERNSNVTAETSQKIAGLLERLVNILEPGLVLELRETSGAASTNEDMFREVDEAPREEAPDTGKGETTS